MVNGIEDNNLYGEISIKDGNLSVYFNTRDGNNLELITGVIMVFIGNQEYLESNSRPNPIGQLIRTNEYKLNSLVIKAPLDSFSEIHVSLREKETSRSWIAIISHDLKCIIQMTMQ